MQGIAAIAEAWLTQRREGAIARVIAAEGLGPLASVTIDFGTAGKIRLIPQYSSGVLAKL